jgi:hypothetical protein
MQTLGCWTALRGALHPVVVGCAIAALGASGCSDASPGSNAAGDPVAGLVDNCGRTVQRDLDVLGLPANGRAGAATSFYDPTADAAGVGFYPLALDISDSPSMFGHGETSHGGSSDPRCSMVNQTFYLQDLASSDGVQLDAQRYPDGQAELKVALDLRFDDVVFPKSLADVAVPLDPATTASSVVIAHQMVMPTAMTLDVRYERPLPNGTSALVQDQPLPLELECKAAYPLTVSWQLSSQDSPLCTRNKAGALYCVVYELQHAAADCRFAMQGQTLITVDGKQAAVDLAGSLTALQTGAALTGARLTIDTIQLR